MCGRYSITTAPKAMRQLFLFKNDTPNIRPRYNAAPTQALPVVRMKRDSEDRELVSLRWGLVPLWAKDQKIGYKMINARAETVANAPSFRAPFKVRRCLVPADGFYEWKVVEGGKQPYRITMKDDQPFAFAGLWERWDKGEEPVETFTIITGEPNSLTAEIHNRMPVILEPDHWDAWLTATDPAIPTAMLQPFPAQLMRAYPISTKVNSPKCDTPDIIEEVAIKAQLA